MRRGHERFAISNYSAEEIVEMVDDERVGTEAELWEGHWVKVIRHAALRVWVRVGASYSPNEIGGLLRCRAVNKLAFVEASNRTVGARK